MRVKEEDKPKLLKAVQKIISSLPQPPLEWAIVGSIKKLGISCHDIDLCLIYSKQEEWMIDEYRKIDGIPINFDLFFLIPITPHHLKWAISDTKKQRIEFFGDI